jgi:hypothetical protein
MSFTFLVKQRPVCVGCGKKCGTRHREWPAARAMESEWDGETWRWKYNPFCTLRCALGFARKAAAQGITR